MKPIISVDFDGRVVRAGQAFGRRRVLPAVMKLLENAVSHDAENVRFGVVHVGCPEVVDPVCDALRARWGEIEILTASATPVIANHVGIGAWGIAYMVEDQAATHLYLSFRIDGYISRSSP